MLDLIEEIDRKIFLLLNDLHTPFWDVIMWQASGKLQWIPLYLLLLFLLYKKYGVQSWKILIGAAVVVTLADQISVQLFKEVFKRYRPCHNETIAELVHIVNNKCGGKYGFVSSHATNTFAIASFIGLLLSKKSLKPLFFLLIWALLVSYSRIYLGVHYPLDIIGGGFLGSVIGYSVYKIIANYFLKVKTKE